MTTLRPDFTELLGRYITRVKTSGKMGLQAGLLAPYPLLQPGSRETPAVAAVIVQMSFQSENSPGLH
jgi:hypothetical protein